MVENSWDYILVFPLRPIGKGRARSTRSGHHYTPKKTREFEANIKRLTAAHFKWPPMNMLEMETVFSFKPAKSNKYSKLIVEYPDVTFYMEQKPDLSNAVKAVEDAMEGIVYTDDKLIVINKQIKIWATEDRITVKLKRIKQEK